MQEFLVPEDCHRQTLLQFLACQLGISKRAAKQLIDRREVFVNSRRVWMVKHALNSGDRVRWAGVGDQLRPDPFDELGAGQNAAKPIEILQRNAHYVVVNKPAGLLSDGENGTVRLVQNQLQLSSLFAVHRLDRDTTGCLIFACDKSTKEQFETLFKQHKIEKTYLALVIGKLEPKQGEIKIPIDGKSAHTSYSVVAYGSHVSLLELKLHSGRMHQIRIHCANLGHPVVGDKNYNTGKLRSTLLQKVSRQMLHAQHLSFVSPIDSTRAEVSAPVPDDFRDWARKFGVTEVI